MESLHLRTYLVYAFYIVRTHPTILLFLGCIGLLNGITVYFPENNFASLVSSLTIISAIFIMPVIYGMYYEIVEEKYTSVVNIFRTYVSGYLLLLFCMYIPIISTTALIMSGTNGEGNVAYVMLTIMLFILLFVYVIPSYYVSGTILDSISYGVQFFFKNLLSSAPVLVMALFSEMLLLISHYKFESLKENSPSLFVVIDFSVYMVATIIDFLLFIMLIYILRNQDLKKREPISD